MNSAKLGAWLVTLPVVGAFALPFLLPGHHPDALREAFMFALSMCGVGLLAITVAQAVKRSMSRRELAARLLVAAGFLVLAFAPPVAVGQLSWIELVGVALALVGILLGISRTLKARAQREADDAAL